MLNDFILGHLWLSYELAGVFLAFAVMIVLGGALIARFDDISFEDAVYFAFMTALTVGFGDLTPRSRVARVVAVTLSFMGIVLTGLFVAIAVHAIQFAIDPNHLS